MTGEAAIRINENSVIRESIYGKRIRSTDVILTGIIYGCASLSMLLPFNSVRFLTTAIVAEMGYASGLHREVLFTIGLVLFAFIMIINIGLNSILKKGEKTK